jgi:hypothetical protein
MFSGPDFTTFIVQANHVAVKDYESQMLQKTFFLSTIPQPRVTIYVVDLL